MQWIEGALEEAQAQAASEGRRVVVKVCAEWCDGCQALEEEVLGRPAGKALLAGTLGVHVDFDREDAAPLVERFAILDLPTVLVLRADGGEAARVTGYDDARSWLAEAKQALEREDEAAEIARELEASPGDRARVLRLGELLLSRRAADGEALLEQVALGDDELASRALFLLARFHHRARRDARTARSLWRELALRFPSGPYVKGALAWHARAQLELGHPEVAAAALEARVQRAPSPEAVLEWARFVNEHGDATTRARVRAAAAKILPAARGPQRDALEELLLAR
jgi:hypothetical protein